MREHVCHPFLGWSDALGELEKPEFWSRYDVPRIGSEATMLDIRHLSLGLRERYGLEKKKAIQQGLIEESQEPEEPTHFIRPVDLSSGKVVISLQDMIDASVALKSNIDVEVTKPYAKWSSLIFPSPDGIIGPLNKGKAVESIQSRERGGDKGMEHVAEVISGLQKEVLLLRNELNFELWHSRENAKHVGRLYEDRILMRSAESERQGLVSTFVVGGGVPLINYFAISTTSFGGTATKSHRWNMTFEITKNSRPLRKTVMRIGRRNYRKSLKSFVKTKGRSQLKLVHSAVRSRA